jgi:hypothetical protein
VADAGFLGSTGRGGFPVTPQIANVAGPRVFGAGSTGALAGPDGDGALATITFEALVKGESELDLSDLQTFSGTTPETPDDMDGMVYVVDAGVSVVPESSSVSRCATFEVDIAIGGDVTDLTGFDINLDWDPALFEVTDIMYAPFMVSTGRTAQQIAKDIDNTAGTLNYAVATYGTAAGPDAPGVLAVVTLEAIGVGTSDLDLHDVLISESGFEVDPAALTDGTAESTKEAVGFELSTIASPQVAGHAFVVTITAVNEDGDPAENFSATVDLSDTTGTLSPTSVEMEDATEDVNMTVTKAQSGIVITAETVNLCGVTIDGDSNAFTVDPDVENPAKVTIDPAAVTLEAGECQVFTLEGEDTWGNTFDVTDDDDTTYTTDGGGTLTDNQYCATTVGDWTVTGTYAGTDATKSDTADVTVEPGPLFAIDVDPDPAEVWVANDQQFTATGYDEYDNVVAITPVWSVTDPDAGTIDAAGLFTASFNIGSYEDAVVATDGAISGAADVVVDGFRIYIPMCKEDS